MLAMWLGVALAAEPSAAEQRALQQVHEIEWARGSVLELASQLAGAAPEARADVALALGRLREAEALDVLVELRDDPAPAVRLAAAQALGWTPGSAEALRAWIAEEPRPSAPAARAAADEGVPVALIRSLGQAAVSEADVEVLRALLREPWPYGAAAARAIGRVAQREVPGADAAVHDLFARLDAPDPRLVADVAWALARAKPAEAAPAEVA
ncbi:MAG: HEAT repeat domain-containing protein, partial [Myxococcota bacterium]